MKPEQLVEQENQIKELWENGELPYLTHLMGGNEKWLCDYFQDNYREGDWVFASHRCHFHYTLAGHSDLIEKVENGKSMFLYGPRFICSAIVGGICSMACGKALSVRLRGGSEKVHAFVGDGATDQGCFWEAVRFAEGRELPITFIVENNMGQCGVSVHARWSGNDFDLKWPMMHMIRSSPKVRYYHYRPKYPHAGTVDEHGKPTRPPIRWKRP